VPGANLRILMRQRLTEITGLSSETVSQLAQSAPRAPPATTLASITTRCLITATIISRNRKKMYVPQEWTPKKPGAGGKNGTKNWDKNGKRGGDRDQQSAPRKPIAVEAPTLIALRTLIHHPQLAAKSKPPTTSPMKAALWAIAGGPHRGRAKKS
jgi:DNA primase